MFEIIFHGRAGQGSKSAAYIIAEAAMQAGKYIQAFPEYGAAREGAPMRVFLRLDDKEIRLHTPILHPDLLMIFDYSLVHVPELYDGIKPTTTLVVNTKDAPTFLYDLLKQKQPQFEGKVFWLDATRLSLDEVGKNLTNTAMLGAFCRAVDFLHLDTLKQVFKHHFEHKLKEDLMHKNLILMDKAYHAVQPLS